VAPRIFLACITFFPWSVEIRRRNGETDEHPDSKNSRIGTEYSLDVHASSRLTRRTRSANNGIYIDWTRGRGRTGRNEAR
jgi:hypothetical protein